jgi:hypothetical protein
MTITRIHFEKLVNLFDSLCKIQQNEIIKFVKLKTELFALLTEISNYRLLEIDLPQKCLEIAASEDCNDFSEEQRLLVVHLADQLCNLLIGKIWYGGELMYHLNRITISSYHLPDHVKKEINKFEGSESDGMKLRFNLKNNGDYEQAIKKLIDQNEVLVDSTLNKYKKIDDGIYALIFKQLKESISSYRSYINTHYPSIANHFSFNNKLVKAYLCDERKNDIVCRVQSYTNDSDISIYLDYYINDFCPRPPYNFEKIDYPLSSWSWFGVNKKNWKLPSNVFSTNIIHKELLNLYLQNIDESELVKFVCFFLKTQNLKVEINQKDQTYLTIDEIHTKEYLKIFHKNEIAEKDFTLILEKMKDCPLGYHKQVLFTTKPDDIILNMFEENKISIRHITDLTNRYFENNHSELIHLYIKSRLNFFNINQSNKTEQGLLLIKELKNCPLGKSGWSSYEKIGSEIFKFLFADSFLQYICETQASNDEDSLRRDLIVHNNYKSNVSFWSRINADFKAKILIVEFKNYKEELSYDTMFSTTKYLRNKSGNFILLLSRNGGKSKLLEQQKELLNEGKLIISLDDQEIIEMIEEKINGRNPIYRLELKYFELLKK